MQNYILMATLRTNLNLRQVDLANKLDINIRTYKLYESGKRIINLEDLNKLSNFFKVSINVLTNLSPNLKSNNIYKDINYHFLSCNLKLLRIKNKLTQEKLAKIMHVGRNSIYKYEKDSHNINVAFLINLALKYNLSIDYMCGKTLKKEV